MGLLEPYMPDLYNTVRKVLKAAVDHSHAIFLPAGHWQAECVTCVTPTAEYVLIKLAFGISLEDDKEAICKWLLSEQMPDGSWITAYGEPGDVSCTSEAYLALKVLGVPVDRPEMVRAQKWMVSHGGIERVRMFTRVVYAGFGLFPWAALPFAPPEIMLLPSWFPVHFDILASWARTWSTAYLLSKHHQTIRALPNGISPSNDYLDELWVNPANKMVPYRPSLWQLLVTNILLFLAALAHKFLGYLDGVCGPLRRRARRACVDRLLSSQESEGDWRSYSPLQYLALLALKDEGYTLKDDPIIRGFEAMEYLIWEDEGGKRCQACPSSVWDTSIMLGAVLEAGEAPDHPNLVAAVSWLRSTECLDINSEWRITKPNLSPQVGGYPWSPRGLKVPDPDDTIAALNAFILQDPKSVSAPWVCRGLNWVIGQQMPDGGIPGFESNNNPAFINKLQFDDKNMFDFSSTDGTGGALKVFSMVLRSPYQNQVDPALFRRIEVAATRAIKFLESSQNPNNGAWLGTWGVRWIFGTCWALNGLQHFASDEVLSLRNGTSYSYEWHDTSKLLDENHPEPSPNAKIARKLISRGISFFRLHQNPDGGWGESLHTFHSPELAGIGASTIPQTSWALMGLLPYLSPKDEVIVRGVKYLVDRQIDMKEGGKGWVEPRATGSGFPGAYDLRYPYYAHHFPMIALSRYARAVEKQENLPDGLSVAAEKKSNGL